MSLALTLLAQIAPEFGGICAKSNAEVGSLRLPIQLVDGRTISYNLELRDFTGVVSVLEAAPERLPAFCPERHINSDGTFCLSYSPVQSLKIEDEDSARAWLETVYKFLKLQERVRSQRKWPNDHGWAHGGAAKHQLQAKIAASKLGRKVTDALSKRQLSVKRRFSKGRPLLELIHNGECLYRVWEVERRVANQRRRCFCGSSGLRRSRTLRKCADHGIQAAEFVFELYEWEREELRYWEAMRGMKCCGTCDNCGLAMDQNDLTTMEKLIDSEGKNALAHRVSDRVPGSGVTEPAEGALQAKEDGHRGSWLTLSLRRPNTHQRNHDDQAHYRIDRVD